MQELGFRGAPWFSKAIVRSSGMCRWSCCCEQQFALIAVCSALNRSFFGHRCALSDLAALPSNNFIYYTV
jgi:hypothetical protein